MGRVGKPVAEHKKDGTFNATRHGNSNLPVEIPDMPADLRPAAQAVWKVVSQLLLDAGIVSKVDGLALRKLCELEERWKLAQDEIDKHGILIQGSKSTIANPAMRIQQDTEKTLKSLYQQFGMTPCGRRGLSLKPAPKTNDETARILGFKRA